MGKPKMHFFRLTDGDSQLTWRSANGKQRSIPLAALKHVRIHTQYTLFH
jgi:hypothetical protein